MRRVRRAKIAGVKVAVISHALDTRADLSAITSHIGVNIPAVAVPDVATLAEVVAAEDCELVAIDEAQFFGPALVPLVGELVAAGTTVIVEGLCVTFDGGPFEPMPTFMAIAEDVLKLTAVCTVCGRDAVFHQRIPAAEAAAESADGSPGGTAGETVAATEIDASHVGGLESYVARCREHFAPPAAPSAR